MAKQRPTLGTYASPVGSMVVPVMQQAQPVNEQAIRETYAFAEAFGDLSQSMVELASVLKTQSNKEQFAEGQKLVNANRKTYADLVKTGQINPSENPWMAVGAQTASGVLEASKSRNEFEAEYSRRVAENPDLLKDNSFFDALAASYAQNKQNEFGTASYLSSSFFDEFNPYMVSKGAEHAGNVAKYRQQKILQSIQVKVTDGLSAIAKARKYGKRATGEPKDVGFLGEMYDLDGNVITELSAGIEIDGKEYEIPLIVPGLSIEGKEQLVYHEAEFKELSVEDQKVILDHAAKRISEGKSPFFSTVSEKVLPDLQAYMDESGANMGMPRTANLAMASYLIEAMSSSGLTYEAEELLRSLKAGTGSLADIEEVKAMLSSAKGDIEKNRFTIKNNEERAQIGLFFEREKADAYGSGLLYDQDRAYNELQDLLDGMTTLSVEDRIRYNDQLVEAINNAQREGQETFDRRAAIALNKATIGFINKLREQGGTVFPWAGLKGEVETYLRSNGVDPESPRGKTANKVIREQADAQLYSTKNALIENLKASASQFPGDKPESLATLEEKPGDSAALKARKADFRLVYNMNQMEAARHFGYTELLDPIRRIFANGISVDVERGLRPELQDVIRIYQSYIQKEGTSGALKLVFAEDSPRGKRVADFLRRADAAIRMGVDMPNAVRDAVQSTNLADMADISQLVDFKPGSQQIEEVKNAARRAYDSIKDRWWIFDLGFADAAVHPDSEAVVSAMMTSKFVDLMQQYNYDFDRALEESRAYAEKSVVLVRGAHINREELDAAGLGREYLMAAADMESPAGTQSPTFVFVGRGANGESVYALRDIRGFAVNNRYYTMADLTSNQPPRDSQGRMTEDLSFRERVIQFIGKRREASLQEARELSKKAAREAGQQFMNSQPKM